LETNVYFLMILHMRLQKTSQILSRLKNFLFLIGLVIDAVWQYNMPLYSGKILWQK